MEGSGECSPRLGLVVENEDAKLVSRLSTILVATIQEARERISQIEYIFCNQLYPNFQSRSASLARAYEEAKREMEDAWKAKEKDLLLRIFKLEADAERGVCLVAEKEMQLKERREESCRLIAEVKRLEEEAELAAQGEVFAVDRVRLLEFELAQKEEVLKEYEREKGEIMRTLKIMEESNGGLREKLEQRGEELHKKRVLLADLRREVDLNVEEIPRLGKKLKEAENVKKLLLDKAISLEKKVIELQEIRNGSCYLTAEKCSHEKKFLQRLEAESCLRQEEKERYNALLKRYKESMSENKYLRGKLGLTEENMIQHDTSENHRNFIKCQQNLPPSNGVEDIRADASVTAAVVPNQVKIERGSGDELDVVGRVPKSIPAKRSPSNFIAPKCPLSAKSAPVISRKRSASTWIATRSRQLKNGADPHDDFLDTPLENVRKNLNRSIKEEADDLLAPVQKDANSYSSDDETQDVTAAPQPQLPQQEQKTVPADGKRDFKYVETVRKKAEREKLKGVECKQCKKFYDSVLQNGGKGSNNQVLRCEHHEGVSRHRYKFAPPSTPEGFWDIGFESEM